jgi:hypothetical protein
MVNFVAKRPIYLRCALIWQRTVVKEEIFSPGKKITIGNSSAATFTIESPILGDGHCLFRHKKSGAELYLKPGMLGRVHIGDQTHEVEELLHPESIAHKRGDELHYILNEHDGGVLVFGRVGILFDFTRDLGEVQTNSVSTLLGLERPMTRMFTVTLAFAMLIAMVSRLLGSTPSAFVVEQIPERIVSYMIDDPERVREFSQEIQRWNKEQETKQRQPDETQPKSSPREVADHKPTPATDTDQERLRQKVASAGVVGAIQAARQKDGALRHVLDEGGLGLSLDNALQKLDRGAASVRVIGSEGTGPELAPMLIPRVGTAEALSEGLKGGAIGTGQTARRVAENSRLAERREARVVVSMPADDASVTGGTLSKKQIADVVLRNKDAIRYCYESQLMRFPTLRGKILTDFIIELDGSVKTAKIAQHTLTQAEAVNNVIGCIVRFIQRWKFPKPEGGKVRVLYPFTFGRAE